MATSLEAMHSPEPTTYKEALSSADSAHWQATIEEDLKSLAANSTWELVEKPPNRKLIGCKWVFKQKMRNGRIERYKGRLVAKGYSQVENVDYTDTFSPVVKLDSLRVLLAKATLEDMVIHHMDVKSAFLNGVLSEELYMKIPEGLCGDNLDSKCCKLKKCLYGLKQANRVWNQKLDAFLLSQKFHRLATDNSVYILSIPGYPLYLTVWVDDLLLFCKDVDTIIKVKGMLSSEFQMSDLGEVSYILGVDITRNMETGTLALSQQSYIQQCLQKFSMTDCHGAATPMETNVHILSIPGPTDATEILDMKRYPYQCLIGSLMYAMLGTRPDIAFSVSCLSRFLTNPGKKHWDAAKRVLRYLKHTQDYKLVYSTSGNPDILGYSDSDWAGDILSRKSTSGYIFLLAGGAVTWKSRKQQTVAISTTEAEYYAVSMAASEAIWLRNFTLELTIPVPSIQRPIQLFCDNLGCVYFTKDPTDHGRLKHIEIRHLFIRDAVRRKYITVTHCRTHLQAADILTKPLPREKLQRCQQIFNLLKMTV
jgi:hypothetical protein